jgi:hypothetical protein
LKLWNANGKARVPFNANFAATGRAARLAAMVLLSRCIPTHGAMAYPIPKR